jgi:hypothetical protein
MLASADSFRIIVKAFDIAFLMTSYSRLGMSCPGLNHVLSLNLRNSFRFTAF